MSYVVNKTDGNIVAVVDDGTVNNTETSIVLVGRGTQSYGEYIAENSVRMLENFANITPPAHPITGQLWYNTTTGNVTVYDGVEWQIPVPQTFYSTETNTTGTATITVTNNSGITIGATSTAQIAVEDGNVVLKTNGSVNALTINPANGEVTVVADPTADLGIVTKQYVDTLLAIGPDADNKATVDTNSLVLVLDGETMISADNSGVTLAGFSYVTNTPAVETNDFQIASTAFVQSNKVSPAFTGVPTAPTASTGTATAQLATTEFVRNSIVADKVSPAFTGVPTAPTATASSNTTQLATTEFVQSNKVSPAFTGTPTVPTASAGTNTTQIASTEFVTDAITTLETNVGIEYAPKASPTFTGIPLAPTAAVSTNTTQIATTAYVMTATEKWSGSRKYVSSSDPTSGVGSDGDFWFKII
jgi:hypothetical protein